MTRAPITATPRIYWRPARASWRSGGARLRSVSQPPFKSPRTGAEDGTRTRDLLITNQLLYQLSYFGARTRRKMASPRALGKRRSSEVPAGHPMNTDLTLGILDQTRTCPGGQEPYDSDRVRLHRMVEDAINARLFDL